MSSALAPLLGGLMIGAAAVLLLRQTGRIAGVSGIVGGLVPGVRGDRAWRLAFVGGLVLGGLLLATLMPGALPRGLSGPRWLVALAGLLVGLGARLGGGCTSGHGVCGLGQRSPRSLVAVLVFMATAMLTANLLRPLLAGGGQ